VAGKASDPNGEAIEDYARKRGLECRVVERQSSADFPPAVRKHLRYETVYVSRELSGKLNGGLEGRLRVQSFGLSRVGGGEAPAEEAVEAVVRADISASKAILPTLICHRHGLGNDLYVTSQMFDESPDARAKKTVEFESIKLGEKFDIEVDPGQDEVWLRELFPPSFIDWLAEKAPQDLIFAADRGRLFVEVPHLEVQVGRFDALCEIASKLGGRIVDECEERTAAGLALPIDPKVTAKRAPGGATIYATVVAFVFTLVFFGFIGLIGGLIVTRSFGGGLIGAAAFGLPFALLVGHRNYAGSMGKYDDDD
jgi:hypothetical protein